MPGKPSYDQMVIVVPHVILGFAPGAIDVSRAANNLTFLLATGGFLVLGG